mmetsp:Transcript_17672/g.70944  ORF Transcript_17672/g.70944 Transcript_17672/m.70944 type:complete len:268 (+) Transcript_17672:58-861(+)
MRAHVLAALVASSVARAGEVKVASSAGKGLVLGLSPSAKQDWTVGDGRITLGGEYDYDAVKFAPSKVAVAVKDKPLGIPSAAKLTWSTPLDAKSVPVVEVAVGDGSKQPKIVLDSTSAKNPVKIVEAKITRFQGLTLEPRWRPRLLSSKSKGLELDVKGDLSAKASFKATLAPETRPKLKFAFAVADDLKLELQPLVGADGTKTKLEIEKAELPGGVKLTAGLLERTVSLAATVPGLLGGTLKPSVAVNLDSPKKTPSFKLSQSFDI